MRGLVLGWYHQRNAGDDRLMHCITHWLHDHSLTFLPHTQIPAPAVLDGHDYVLIGGGSVANEVAGVFHGMQKWVPKAMIPVFCAGIGISDHEQFRNELQAIPDSGGRIWVRDEQSAINSRLQAPDVEVGPDLSWLFPLRFKIPRHGTALNLRPGGGPRVLEPARWQSALASLPDVWPWPLCFGRDDDRALLSKVLLSPVTVPEFDPTGASRADIVVAMRFHALIFAIQTGTPFVAISHTKKVRYLLQETGLQDAEVAWDRPESFASVFEAVQKRMNTDRLLEISDMMHLRTRAFADRFRGLIENAVSKNSRRNRLGHRLRSHVRRSVGKWF